MSTRKSGKKDAPLNKRKSNRDSKGKFVKGNKSGPGRPVGSKNKYSQILMDLVFEIEADLADKKKGLRDCAEQDPKWFYEKFLAKVMPKPVEVSGDIDTEITISWEK